MLEHAKCCSTTSSTPSRSSRPALRPRAGSCRRPSCRSCIRRARATASSPAATRCRLGREFCFMACILLGTGSEVTDSPLKAGPPGPGLHFRFSHLGLASRECNTSLYVIARLRRSLELFAAVAMHCACDDARLGPVARHRDRRGLPARRKIPGLQHRRRWSRTVRSAQRGCRAIDSGIATRAPTAASSCSSMRRKATKAPAFNHAAVAAALTTAMGKPVTADALALHADHLRRRQPVVLVRQRHQAVDLRRAGQAVHVGRSAGAGAEQRALARRQARRVHPRLQPVGPRHRHAAQDKQLTTDGVKDYGYATDNAGWITQRPPGAEWSPDSKKIATFQQDQRKAGEMYLVNTVGRPSDAAGVEVSAAGRRDRSR